MIDGTRPHLFLRGNEPPALTVQGPSAPIAWRDRPQTPEVDVPFAAQRHDRVQPATHDFAADRYQAGAVPTADRLTGDWRRSVVGESASAQPADLAGFHWRSAPAELLAAMQQGGRAMMGSLEALAA